MLKLLVIVASTRPVRVGLSVGRWFEAHAIRDGRFEVAFADLKELALPMMDEPKHPRLQDYAHDHTKAWSRMVADADAFVIVTPEYNYAFPASIKNALDYLLKEWAEKPVGIVSYGGISGGLRSAEKLRSVLIAFDMMPIAASVPIPRVSDHRGEDGTFNATEQHARSADAMLAALARWGAALKRMRDGG